MRNFNINVLGSVQSVIGKQSYQIMRYVGRVKNSAGYWVSSFSDPEDMSGSVQPVNAKMYKDLGLDLKKSYIKIYDTELINTMSRNTNGDQIIWNGFIWTIPEELPWNIQGGWNYVMCVKLEAYTDE